MEKNAIFVAAFILLLEAGYTKIQHEHVHHEQPRWEIIDNVSIRTSGDTSTGFSDY